MRCPSCNAKNQYTMIKLHAEGFYEDINTCQICGTVWSVNHGLTEIVKDCQRRSFLESVTESVEGDDYSRAA